MGVTFPTAGGDPDQHERCAGLVERTLEMCPKVGQLRLAMQRLGRDIPVSCMHCPERKPGQPPVAGGYMPDTGTIVMCQNWAAQQPDEVPNTVAHELIHAYDDARAKLDWTNLVHHACTEIRAANLSGDCTFSRELNRSQIHPLYLRNSGQRCIRRRAQISVSMNPSCPNQQVAEAAVDKAWIFCFADTAPFDRVP